MNRGAQRLEEGGASQCEVVQRERAKMTLARSTLLLLLSVSTCSSALLHAMRCIGPTVHRHQCSAKTFMTTTRMPTSPLRRRAASALALASASGLARLG